jgi:CubicO group peptidase (beta-lactamase class C family)
VTHHAGLPEMPPNLIDRDGDGQPDPDADPLSPGHDYARADLLAILPGLPLGGAAPYKYSNLGLGLLSLMLQDHSGTSSFDAVLGAHLKPALGLTSTWGNVDAIPADARSRLVQGYGLRGGQRLPGYPAEMGVLAGAGEIVTTGADMARFLGAVTGHTPTALDPAIALALTPVAASSMADVDLGYAFEVHDEATSARYTKGGGTPSFTAYLSFHRTPAVGAFVMTSCTGFQATRGLAMTIDDRLVEWSQP